MAALSASLRLRRRFVAACFLCSLVAAPLLTAGAAGAQEGSTDKSADDQGKLPSSPQAPVDQAAPTPHWTFSAEGIFWRRTGGVNQPLVSRVPGDAPFYVFPTPTPPSYDSATYPGVEALNSDQLRQGLSAGPKLSLTYHDDSGYGVELSYFDVLGLSAAKAIGPDSPADWLVMKAPGSFWQTQDFPYQAMAWQDVTSLYGFEVNGRLDLSPRVTILAGLRWLALSDELQGTLTPADRGEPSWKQANPSSTLLQIPNPPLSTPVVINPPFWTANTTNNLYRVQIGVAGKIWELGRLSLDGLIKAGVYDNYAEQSALVSMAKQLYPAQAATNAAAFVGEAGLHAKYQLTDSLALKAGYQALWLDGVALAPGQIRETYTTSPSPSSPSTPVSASALGVNCRSNALFQGVSFGLEYSF